jgi:Kef-type K+ transport system membrane component KefB
MAIPLEFELRIVAYLFALWTSEKALSRLKLSPIVANILVGVVLGPPVLDFIPFTDTWSNIGQLGVLMLVLESGLMVDFAALAQSGARAFAMASTGVFFPVVFSIAFANALGLSVVTGLSIGASLAPTSLGFTAQLLKDFGALTTREGQFICTAAVIDDVLSLLLLAQITAMQGTPTPFQIVLPFLSSLGSIAVGVLILFMMGKCCKGTIDKINSWSEETPEMKKEREEEEDAEKMKRVQPIPFILSFFSLLPLYLLGRVLWWDLQPCLEHTLLQSLLLRFQLLDMPGSTTPQSWYPG